MVASILAGALRKPVLEWAVDHYLQQADIEAEMTISELGFTSAVIEDFQIRNALFERITADRLEFHYNPANLLAGMLPELEVRGLKVVQTKVDEGRTAEKETESLSKKGRKSDRISSPKDILGNWTVSRIHIRDAEYTRVVDGKRYSLALEALLKQRDQERHSLDLSVNPIEESALTVSGDVSLDLFDLLPVSVNGQLEATAPQLGTSGQISFSGQEIDREPEVKLDGELQIAKGDWESWTAQLPEQNGEMEAALSLDGTIRLPETSSLSTGAISLADWSEGIEGEGQIGVRLANLATPLNNRMVDASMMFNALLEDASLELFSERDATLSLEGGTGDDSTLGRLLQDSYSLRLPKEVRDHPFIKIHELFHKPSLSGQSGFVLLGSNDTRLSGQFSGDLHMINQEFSTQVDDLVVKGMPLNGLGPNQIHGTASLSGTLGDYKGHMQLKMLAEGLETEYASAGKSEASVSVEVHGKGAHDLKLNTRQASMLAIKGLSLPAGLGIPESQIDIGQFEVAYKRDRNKEDYRLGVEGSLEIRTLTFRQFRSNGTPLTGEMQPLSLDFGIDYDSSLPASRATTFKAEGELEEVALNEANISLEDLAFEASYPPAEANAPLIQVKRGRLSSTSDPEVFTVFDLNGLLYLRDPNLVFSLAAESPNNKARLTVKGAHNLETGNGSLDFSLPSHRFLVGGLQPAELFPVLDMLEEVEGDSALNLDIAWSEFGLNGHGQLFLTGLDLIAFDTAMENLNSTIALNSLIPLSTPESQAFSIDSTSIGNITLSDITGRLSLEKSETALPDIHLDNLRASFAGGHLQIEDGELNLSRSNHRLVLKADNLDISQLIDLLEIEDLEATGKFTGEIPITISGSTFEVADGRLESSEDGQIAFKSEDARSALASGGESVNLMLDALENFHYDNLRLGIHKPAEGESRLSIKLEGRNPDVLDGYPFDLNINLSGDLGPILRAVSEGRQLSQNVLNEMLELVQ